MRHTEFQTLFDEAINSKGKIALPNVEEIPDPQEALRLIYGCMAGMERPYELLIKEIPRTETGQTRIMEWYPKVFQHGDGMGGRFDGTGVILASRKAYTFTMCQHDWNESGANHSRGWHPRRCRKCGFDASIDSGD